METLREILARHNSNPQLFKGPWTRRCATVKEINAFLLAIPGATHHAVYALTQYPLPYNCFYQNPSTIAPDEDRLFGKYPTDPFVPSIYEETI